MKRSPLKRRTPLRRRGESRDDAMWRNIRARRLELDGYECQGPARGLTGYCSGQLEVHHIRRRSQGGTHELTNLLSLCTWHHTMGGERDSVHGNPARAYELGLLARSVA